MGENKERSSKKIDLENMDSVTGGSIDNGHMNNTTDIESTGTLNNEELDGVSGGGGIEKKGVYKTIINGHTDPTKDI